MLCLRCSGVREREEWDGRRGWEHCKTEEPNKAYDCTITARSALESQSSDFTSYIILDEVKNTLNPNAGALQQLQDQT